MSLLQSILIGIIQGLTEFIPVSSTAHMTIWARIMNLVDPAHPEQWTAFMAIVQLGTLAAVLLYFAKDIQTILAAWWAENINSRRPMASQSDDSRMGWYVVIGSLPIMLVGYALKKVIEGSLTKDLHLIAIMLVVVSGILIVAERVSKRTRLLADLKLRDAVIIGLSQCFALIPGTSRSGSTISAGLFLGMSREAAARFSFLLSIPAVAASGLYECVKEAKMLDSSQLIAVGVATIVAAIVGYASIALLLRYLRSNSMMVFIVYRIVLAVCIGIWLW